jgi:hypothetical protein
MEQAYAKIDGSDLPEEKKAVLRGLCSVPNNGNILSAINLSEPTVVNLTQIILANTAGKVNFILNPSYRTMPTSPCFFQWFHATRLRRSYQFYFTFILSPCTMDPFLVGLLLQLRCLLAVSSVSVASFQKCSM